MYTRILTFTLAITIAGALSPRAPAQCLQPRVSGNSVVVPRGLFRRPVSVNLQCPPQQPTLPIGGSFPPVPIPTQTPCDDDANDDDDLARLITILLMLRDQGGVGGNRTIQHIHTHYYRQEDDDDDDEAAVLNAALLQQLISALQQRCPPQQTAPTSQQLRLRLPQNWAAPQTQSATYRKKSKKPSFPFMLPR